MPYHIANKGFLFKCPIYYKPMNQLYGIPYDSFLDAGGVEDKRVKLSHHKSGFIQFSGDGILSGREENGDPKGIGVQSWPLDTPATGPSFGITFWGLSDFQLATPKDQAKLGIVFDLDDLPNGTENGFVLEGFYFHPRHRGSVKLFRGHQIVQIFHPSGRAMKLRVVMANPNECDFPGLIGFDLRRETTSFSAPSGYVLGSSSGNIRREDGERVGDALYCMFPAEMTSDPRRDLNFVPG